MGWQINIFWVAKPRGWKWVEQVRPISESGPETDRQKNEKKSKQTNTDRPIGVSWLWNIL